MAEFDPYAPQEPTGNYLGYSRGSLPDTSIGGLFSDLGTTLSTGVRARNQLDVWNMQQEARPVVDEIQDVFTGRRDFDAVRGGGRLSLLGPDSPRELQEYATRLEALSQARASGRVRDSHYWTLLDMEARKIRQRYPGYRNEIDQLMSSTTGQIPANALINSLDSEARAGRTSAETQRQTWIERATAVGQAYDLVERERAGRPVTNEELQQRVNTVRAAQIHEDGQTRRYAIERARGEHNSAEAQRGATIGLAFNMANTINAVTGPFGSSARELEEAIRRYESVPVAQRDPNTVGQLVSQWNGLRQIAERQAHVYMQTPTVPNDPESSPAARIGDPTKVKQIIDMHMSQYDAIGSALTRGETGIIHQFKLQNEQLLNGDVSAVLTRSEWLREQQTLRTILGPQAYSQIYTIEGVANLRRQIDLIRSRNEGRLGLSGPAGRTLAGAIEDTRANVPAGDTRVANEQSRTLINNAVRVLSHPEANPELIANHVNNIFGPGNERVLERFTDKAEVYRQLVGNPEAVRNIMRLRPTATNPGNAAAYENYRRFALSNFGTLMTEQIATANNIVVANNTDLRLDQTTWTFSLDGQYTAGQRQTVDTLNRTLSGVRTLLTSELTQPWEAERALGQVLQGLDMNRARPAGGLWESMINKINDLTGGSRTYGPNTTNVETGHYAPALDRIALPESGTHGYEAIYSPTGGARVPGLEQMTLGQVRQYQRNYIAAGGTDSSAIGRYQFTQATFDRITDKLGLDRNTTVFNRATQDRMAVELMRERGLDRYLANPSPAARETLLDNLASEWASIGDRTGRSRYAGIAGNRASPGARDALGRVIDQMVRNYGR